MSILVMCEEFGGREPTSIFPQICLFLHLDFCLIEQRSPTPGLRPADGPWASLNWAMDTDLQHPARTHGGCVALADGHVALTGGCVVLVRLRASMTCPPVSMGVPPPPAHRARIPPNSPQSEKGWGPLYRGLPPTYSWV